MKQHLALAQPQEDARRTSAAAKDKVLVIRNLTWKDIDALSRDSTLFLLAVRMLEEQCPHLPIASDQIGGGYDCVGASHTPGNLAPAASAGNDTQ